MNDKVKRVQHIINGNQKHIAFLIGNGINRHNSDNEQNDWLAMLKNLWDNFTTLGTAGYPFPTNPEKIDISYTGLYDVIKAHAIPEYLLHKDAILEESISDMQKWKPKEHHIQIIEKAKELNAPVLTTNFDENLSKSIGGIKFRKMTKGQKGFTHHYPWECYYSSDELSDNLRGFAIWNIHGTSHYKKSIKLGLNDYMGMVHRAKELIANGLFSFRGGIRWGGSKTWLNIFFYKSLLIFGLGLSREEVFLRWLLAERHKYLKKLNPTFKWNIRGWYVHVEEKEGEIDYGKKLFLKSANIEVLKVPTYKDLYETLWPGIRKLSNKQIDQIKH